MWAYIRDRVSVWPLYIERAASFAVLWWTFGGLQLIGSGTALVIVFGQNDSSSSPATCITRTGFGDRYDPCK